MDLYKSLKDMLELRNRMEDASQRKSSEEVNALAEKAARENEVKALK